MLNRYYKILFTCFPLLATTAYADFFPPNKLHLEDNVLRNSSITEKDFNAAIDEVLAVYGPIVAEAHNATLKVNRLWSNSTVNASADQWGTSWQVNMYGGLARRPEVTRDAFTLVLCHELGHHLGGYPFTAMWAANEGQSDYFATQSCAKVLWQEQRAKNSESRDLIAERPKAACDAVWSTEADQDLCYRLMVAGKAIADLAGSMSSSKVSWDSPDSKVVSKTYNGHSDGQCRLDTYVAGALCEIQFDTTLIPGKDLGIWNHNSADAERETAKYTCTQYMKNEVGYRPACWFKSVIK